MEQEHTEQIIAYTTGWCPDCHRTKYFLDEHGIDYVEIDVEQVPAGMAFVKRVNGGIRVVPTLVFPDGQILVEPSDAALAAKLGIEPQKSDTYRL